MYKSALVLVMLVLLTPASANPPDGYPFLRFDQAMQQAKADAKLVFVYFGRYGCSYCDRTNKEAFSDSSVRAAYVGHYVLTYVDSEGGRRLRLPSGERITEREFSTRYNAAITPVFSFLRPDGTAILRLVGLQDKAALLEADRKIQKALAEASNQ
jgi:thioredoxin-related protein